MNQVGLKKFLVLMALALVAIFIQGSLLRFALPSFFVPNLLLVIVVFLGFYEVTPAGASIVFLLGLEADLCSGVLLGPSAAAFAATFGILASFSSRLFVESSIAIAIGVFGAALVSNVIYLSLLYEFSDAVRHSFLAIANDALVTAIVAPFFFPLLKRLLLPRRERPMPRAHMRAKHKIMRRRDA